MRIIFTDPFRYDYQKLSGEIIRAFDKTITLLHADLRHPSLHVKKLPGTHIWYGRITRGYRFTFEYKNDTIVLRRIGLHTILGKERRSL